MLKVYRDANLHMFKFTHSSGFTSSGTSAYNSKALTEQYTLMLKARLRKSQDVYNGGGPRHPASKHPKDFHNSSFHNSSVLPPMKNQKSVEMHNRH
jgi:hypothetical protein